jgi:small subunit ribosomal protein S16
MTVRLRFARHGTRNNPFYHIVAINQRLGRNAKPLELLGVYDPIPRVPVKKAKTYPEMDATSSEPDNGVATKKVEWSVERIKWWIGKGAQPSDSVLKLLTMVGFLFLILSYAIISFRFFVRTGSDLFRRRRTLMCHTGEIGSRLTHLLVHCIIMYIEIL